MAVQINVAANQAALTASIQAGVQAYNQRFAQNNPINLSINQRAFSQPLGRMTGDVKDFEAALAASNARVIAFGASTAVLGGVIRSFKELANVTIDVEKNLADINRVFGLTTGQLQKFSTDLFSVGKQTASSFDDASKAALEFSRQGLKAEEVLIRTKDALTLARVAGISTANSVDALTSTINGFSATGITTTQILNKLVAVEQDFAVGAGDLAEALSRTGQAAQEAGVSLDQLNALVTSAQQSTARGGAVIGNALKTIFTRLQRTDTLDQLEAFNIAVRDVQGNTLPAVTILQNFAGAYKGLADAQRAQLSEQVAGVYQVNILKAIVGDLNKSQGVYAGALQRGASATNEAEIATAKLNQTLDALLKQTATSTQQLANNIGKVTFEPLARYGTEQLKSLVESMNEILEGEGVGSTFANGLLKGIRNVIAGPGAIAAFFTLFKLIQNSFTYLAQALPQIAGITTETQNRKNIEQSILQIMQQQGPVSQALAGTMGNQAAQAQLLLQLARQQTAEYQIQSTLAKQLAAQLAGQGVRVKGSGGLQATRAGGYIPNATRMAEAVGAQAGGYAPGKVVKSPVGGVMNTAEDVKYVPGFAQPFINPPAGSKAGRSHRQNSISRTGVDPYMYSGFIPNFAIKKIDQFAIGRGFEASVGNDIGVSPAYNSAIDFNEVRFKPINKGFNPRLYKSNSFADAHAGYGHTASQNISKIINHLGENYYGYLPKQGSSSRRIKLNDKSSLISNEGLLGDLFMRPYYTEIIGAGSDSSSVTQTSLISSLKTTAKNNLLNGLSDSEKENILKRKITMQFAQDKVYGSGFIPNFAIPMEAGRIPWFKKYSTLLKNTSGDKDLFRQKDFPTFGNGSDHFYATNGNNDMVGSLYEKFILSAMNIARNSSIFKTTKELGLKQFPVTDLGNTAAFDLGEDMGPEGLIGIQAKAGSKNNQTSGGGVNKTLTSNIERFGAQNPSRIKDLKKAVLIYNDPRYHDPTGKNPAGFLSTFEQTISGIVKSNYSSVDEALKPKLTKVTDDLLSYYEKNKNTKNAKSLFDGFIPNFNMGNKMRENMVRNNLRPILFDLANNTYGYSGQDGKEYLYHKDIYNNKLKTKGANVNDYDFAELHNLVRGFIYPTGQITWDYSDKQQEALKDSNIKAKVLAKLNTATITSSPSDKEFKKITSNKADLKQRSIKPLNIPPSQQFRNRFPDDEPNRESFNGFIPNFAYKQAVMGLEESMSGEKAVFDNKPFPHIRNKSQPTFSSAISDHGGLSNALSDSMRGQKNAGLMSKGFVPNFAAPQNNRDFDVVRFSSLISKSVDDFGKKLSNKIIMVRESILLGLDLMNTSFDPRKIERTAESTAKKIISSISNAGNVFNNSTKASPVASQRLTAAQMAASFGSLPTKNSGLEKFSEGLSKASTAIAIAGPMLAGFAEQAIYGNTKRTDMTSGERIGQSALSTGLSSVSTGAGIGASFGLPGVIIGGAIGAMVALTSAFNAATLSVEELSQLNQEQAQKTQVSISAASSYIEAQKSLTEMISSGASSSDIEIATKKLSTGFNEIADVKLQEIFNATGGDVKKMTEELQKYTNETTKKSAVKKGLIEKIGVEDRVSALSTGLNKEQKKSYIEALKDKNLRQLKLQKQNITIGQQLFADNYVTGVQTSNQSASKDVAARMLKNVGMTSENDPNYESNLKAAMTQIMDMSISQMDALIAGLEKNDIVSQAGKAAVNFKQAATRSFNQIFLDMEQVIAKSAFEVALNFEKDSGSRRIQSAILDFSTNFQDSLNSFISNNLPDARKFDFTAATAGQKAQMLLQKSQQDYDKAIAEQANEKSLFLTKNSENLMEKFKSSFLPSQASAEFFQSNILPQIQAGTFTGDAKSLSEQFKSASFTKAQNKVGAVGMNLTDVKGASETLREVNFQMEILANGNDTESETYKNLLFARQALIDLQNQTALFENENEMTKLQNVITTSVREQQQFEQKQANAKKEAEINKQLSAVSIKANEAMAVKKAIVDKENLMRLENMKNVSAAISNNLEISKAKSNAKINTLQGDLADPRLDYGLSAKEMTGRKIAIESQILKTQRAEEDAAISAEIQQRVLQMAAEQDNTNALYDLTKAITDYMGNLLQQDLGGAGAIAEMQNNPYMGKNIAFERANLGPEASAEQTKMLDQAESYSAQFQAYQRTQQSKTSANIIGKLDAAGFNATDKDGKLLMSQKDQLDTLTKMSEDYEKSGDVVAKGIVDRYKAEIINKKTSLAYTRENIDEEVRRKAILEQQSRVLTERFKKGYSGMSAASDRMIEDLVERTPERFADGMTNALMEVAKGTKSIGDAFKDMAINFGQEIMQAVMRAAIGKMVGSAFTSLFGQAGGSVTSSKIGRQTGGVIHAQNGMYISGGRTGDKNPAMLEDGEYVLNREAVKSFGGVKNLDKMNYDIAPRFGKKMQGGGSVNLFAGMGNNKKGEYDYTGNLMSGSTNMGAINESDYTAYAYAESDYFKKMREKSIADEQERVQKKFEKDQKNAQLISSIVGAVGSIALGVGLSGLSSAATASKGLAAASKAGEVSLSTAASETTKAGFAEAQKAGGKAFSEFAKNNPADVLIKGQSLSSLNMMNQFQSGVNPLKISGGFGKFNGNAQLTNVLSQQGFSAAQKTAGSGLFGGIFSTGISTTGANVRRGKQTGGLIAFNSGGFVPYGSRLSDTIPALLTGGEYVMNNTAVKKYGLGTMSSMNAGAYQEGGSTATSSNNTNNNATSIAINIDKSGKSVYGANSSSYEKQDIAFTKEMAQQINGIVLRSMSNEKRYGGELYKNSSRT